MKLEVGQFVRTDKVGIKKIYEIDNNKTKYKYLYKLKNQDGDGCIDLGALCENNIIKEPSFNVIDVLEVGDYVNGSPICSFKTDEKDRIWIYTDSNYKCGYLENEIKSIVTKELFEIAEYRIGE